MRELEKLKELFKIEKEYAFSGTLIDFNEKIRTFKSINIELLSALIYFPAIETNLSKLRIVNFLV